jgi:hypothetical protein
MCIIDRECLRIRTPRLAGIFGLIASARRA